jgi:hypothetical protein
MSIDTPEKRKSAAGVKRFLARVTPNALKDQEWRQQVGRIYSGILAALAPDSNIDDSMSINRGPFDDIMVLDTMVAQVADDIMSIQNDPDDIMILTRQ